MTIEWIKTAERLPKVREGVWFDDRILVVFADRSPGTATIHMVRVNPHLYPYWSRINLPAPEPSAVEKARDAFVKQFHWDADSFSILESLIDAKIAEAHGAA